MLEHLIYLTDRLVHGSGWWLFYEKYRYSGLETLLARNPLLLLGVVPHWKVSLPKDKVCGIMQVFGLQLDRTHSLEQLEVKLCRGIIRRSPVIGQAFVHLTEPPQCHPSWQFRISTKLRIDPATSEGVRVAFSQGQPYKRGRAETPFDYTKIVPNDFYDVREVDCDYRAIIWFENGNKMIFKGKMI